MLSSPMCSSFGGAGFGKKLLMQLQDDLKVILYSRGLPSERDVTCANKRWTEATRTRHDKWASYIPREPRLTNHTTQLHRQLWLEAFCLLMFLLMFR